VRCGSLNLKSALRNRRSALQSTSCNALEVAFHYACLLGFLGWGLISLSCPISLRQGQFSISLPTAVRVSWWFALYFSILRDSLPLGVAHWLRRWALWSATCSALGSGFLPTALGLPAFLVFVYWQFMLKLVPCPSPILQCSFQPPLLLY
jgi:hypothetical protein